MIGQLHERGARLIAHGGEFNAILEKLERTREWFDEVLR